MDNMGIRRFWEERRQGSKKPITRIIRKIAAEGGLVFKSDIVPLSVEQNTAFLGH